MKLISLMLISICLPAAEIGKEETKTPPPEMTLEYFQAKSEHSDNLAEAKVLQERITKSQSVLDGAVKALTSFCGENYTLRLDVDEKGSGTRRPICSLNKKAASETPEAKKAGK